MSWNTPITFITDETLTAEQLNQMLNENMNETATAKAQGRGGYFVSDSSDSLAFRKPVVDFVPGHIEITNTGFVSSDGPEVTVEHSTGLFALWGVRIYNSGGTGSCDISVSGGGASPSINNSVRWPGEREDIVRFMSFRHVTGLTPGTSTVTLQYVTSGGTANFAQRRLLVWPL